MPPPEAAAPIRGSAPQRARCSSPSASAGSSSARPSSWPWGQSTGLAKNTARLPTIPAATTVSAVGGAPSRPLWRLASTGGALRRMKLKQGGKQGRTVNHPVTRAVAAASSDPTR